MSGKRKVAPAKPVEGEPGQQPCPERSFLNAVAAQLARTGSELEAKSSLVASIVREDGMIHRDLMRALQSFDLLEQELAAMVELLMRYADLAKDRRTIEAIEGMVLSGVRLTDLKSRIAHSWRGEAPARPHSSDDELF